MKIYGLNKTTLLDYPGRVAATIFSGRVQFPLSVLPEQQPGAESLLTAGALCHRSFILFKKTSGNPGRRVRHRR